MTKDTDPFSELQFEFPNAWDQDWEELADGWEGTKGELIRTLGKGASTLKIAATWQVSPERLAWLVLWTRNWTQAKAAIAALDGKSTFLLELIWRSAFELNLQISAILNPKAPGIWPKSEFTITEIEEISERLRAYLAWALDSDRRYLSGMLRRDTMDKVFNAEEEYDEVADEKLQPLTQALWGDFKRPVVGHEAAEEKKKARSYIFGRRNRIVGLLDDSRLQKWRNLIERDRPRTFFAMLCKFDSSITNRLKAMDMEIGKSLYEHPSGLLHGSSVEGFLKLSDTLVVPDFSASETEAERESASVRRYCHNNGFGLELIARILDADLTASAQE